METELKLLIKQILDNQKEANANIKEIKNQTIKTNSRVTILELKQEESEKIQSLLVKETEFLRLIAKYPIVVRLFMLAIFGILGMNVYELFFKLF